MAETVRETRDTPIIIDWRERYYTESTNNIKEDIRELKRDIREIKQDLNSFKTETRELMNEMRERIDGLLWKLLLGISAILGAFLGLTKYFAG